MQDARLLNLEAQSQSTPTLVKDSKKYLSRQGFDIEEGRGWKAYGYYLLCIPSSALYKSKTAYSISFSFLLISLSIFSNSKAGIGFEK